MMTLPKTDKISSTQMSNMLSDTPNDTLDYSMRMELEQVTRAATKLVPQLLQAKAGCMDAL